ncbi:hypothetical protein BDV38DRAFT_251261 [Aspergillus pseudotamarii]|uniref:Uncharacterized protein n=1 Tax=Aspergillus pseudotamarii TaxID=132259 RepID=A0A5N6SPC6_ASPPS|nr:uncharacterized protein BDV38DRAFT_251261 [Aspergillus pseudotamarii]KAE8135709.1 hypothetical protein BDV38DRAFT_251261 [Aspergillus pseudotamarii]
MERLVDLLPKTLQCLDRKTLSGRMRKNSTMIVVMRIPRPRHSIFTMVVSYLILFRKRRWVMTEATGKIKKINKKG